jgi:hypothetical protein
MAAPEGADVDSPLPDPLEQRWRLGMLVAVGLLCTSALTVYSWVFEGRVGGAINPDWPGWLTAARDVWWPYSDVEREPGHALVVKVMLALIDDPHRAIMLSTVAETLLAIVALVALARRFVGRLLSVLVATVFALNPVVAFYSVGGLREPLQTATCLFVVWATLLALERAPEASTPAYKAAVPAGLAGGVLGLVRVWALPFAFVVPAFLALGRRRSARWALLFATVCVAIAVALYAPRWIASRSHTGADVGWVKERLPLTDAGGLDVFAMAWLTVKNVALYVTGYLTYFFGGRVWPVWLVLSGCVVDVRRHRGALTVAMYAAVGAFLPLLHLNPEPGQLGIENRFMVPSFAFAVLLGGLALQAVSDRIVLPRAPAWLRPGLRPAGPELR